VTGDSHRLAAGQAR